MPRAAAFTLLLAGMAATAGASAAPRARSLDAGPSVQDAAAQDAAAPESEPTVLAAAFVTVTTNVEDADLQVDDEPAGKAAAGAVAVPPGKRRIWATKPGYYPASKMVTLEPGERIEIAFDLKELPKAEIPPPTRTTRALSLARRKEAPFIVGGAGVLATAALGVWLARRRRGVRAAPSSAPLPKLDAFAASSGDRSDEHVQPTPEHTVPIVLDPDAATSAQTHAGRLGLSGGARTDVGRVKPNNQDSHLVDLNRGLLVVADGIGGFAGGEVASATAVDVIGTTLGGQPVDVGLLTHLPRPAAELATALFLANRAIREKGARDTNLADMGTTCVAARFCLAEQRLYVAHVGDSRVYRLRRGTLQQITTDHTMGALGLEGKRAGHLARALGTEACPKIDVLCASPCAGDVYLLCCDGLTKMVSDAEITSTLLDALLRTAPPEAAAARLVELANAHGGLDNITVAVAYVSATGA